jgi:hypothetical protein
MNTKTFTGYMAWMYEDKHLQALWTGCMNTKTFTGWLYEDRHLQAPRTGYVNTKTPKLYAITCTIHLLS